ncbi:hypothetical protein [Mesorhizobium sp. M7A.F.Ca.ET.027.02.1.1]|uniref:hypothetical protein n=1 Tax=Mesorhizobium sp. M7A.F.Ca.ET.027.02.1.1 TaxID=2496655 RepID=UPI001FE04678|nr:hypothetical protein [Mesorhizobium sp. M7A.F.Ca.ET.027.02.1.1]
MPHDRYPVAESGNLPELVRDQNHGVTLPRQSLGKREKRARFLVGQHRRRFVHDQNSGAQKHDLDDLGALAFGDRKVRYQLVRIDGQADLARLGGNDRRRIAQRFHSSLAAEAEENIFGNRKTLDQPEMLMDHAETGGGGFQRAAQTDRFAVDRLVAPVSYIDAGRHVHQSGLACTVLTDDGMHLPPFETEGRIAERGFAVKRLAYAAHQQSRRRARRLSHVSCLRKRRRHYFAGMVPMTPSTK